MRRAPCRPAAAVPPDVDAAARLWLKMDADPSSRALVEVALASGDGDALAAMMAPRLTFGTAGIRGAVGPGFARMNVPVVTQTAQGLCAVLEETEVGVGWEW